MLKCVRPSVGIDRGFDQPALLGVNLEEGSLVQMQSEQFVDRFAKLFDQGGLMNVKFFVTNKNASWPAFLEEAAGIQDTISAGAFTVVDSVDGSAPQKRFDAAF